MVHAQGPLGPIFDLPPWQVGLINFGLILSLYEIEVLRSIFDSKRRPPFGLAIFRWNTNWLGDTVGLSLAAAGIAAFYQHVRPAYPGWVDSWQVTVLAILTAVAITDVFIGIEEADQAYTRPPHVVADHWNANRIYHTVYFGLMVFILATAGLRALGGIGGAVGFFFMALDGFVIWAITSILDAMRIENPIWRAIKKRWPRETRII